MGKKEITISPYMIQRLKCYFNTFFEDFVKTDYYTRLISLGLNELPEMRIDIRESKEFFIDLFDLGVNEVEIRKNISYGDLYYTFILYVDTKFLLTSNQNKNNIVNNYKQFDEFMSNFRNDSEYYNVYYEFELKISSDVYDLDYKDNLDFQLLLISNLGETKITKNLYKYSYHLDINSLYINYKDFKRLKDANITIKKNISTSHKDSHKHLIEINCNSFIELKNLFYMYLHDYDSFSNEFNYKFTLFFDRSKDIKFNTLKNHLSKLLQDYNYFKENFYSFYSLKESIPISIEFNIGLNRVGEMSENIKNDIQSHIDIFNDKNIYISII